MEFKHKYDPTYPSLSDWLCLSPYYRYLDAVSLGRLALTSKQMADHVLHHLEDGQNILRLLWCLRREANFQLHAFSLIFL